MRSSSDPIRFSSGKTNFQKSCYKATHALFKVATKQHRAKFKRSKIMEIRTLFIIFKAIYQEYKEFIIKEIKKHPNKIITIDDYIYEILDISDDFDDMIMRCIDINIERGLLFTSKTKCNVIISGDLISEYKYTLKEDRQIRSEFFDYFEAMVLIKYYGIDNAKIESPTKYINSNGLSDTQLNFEIEPIQEKER